MDERISFFAKGVTGYAFRNGIAEDYHAAGYLDDKQMKALNQYMVDRVGFVFKLLLEDRWDDLELVLGYHALLAIPHLSCP